MLRLFVLLTTLVALAPAPAAQSNVDSALVAQIYADLARGDVPAVAAVLDDHVVWVEGAHSLEVGRYVGPGTVAAQVLHPQTARAADGLSRLNEMPGTITIDTGRVVAVGPTRRIDPATGRLIVTRFRHVWQVLDGRVVSVHRSDDGPDLSASSLCGPEPC